MKKIKKRLFTLFVGTSFATSLFLASCGGGNNVKYEFNVNGGENQASQEVEVGKEFTLPTPKRDGYKFVGWYNNPEFTGDPITVVTASENMTFYAKWVEVDTTKYTVSLNLNGGTLDIDTLSLVSGDNILDSLKDHTPTLGKAKFAGWYLNDKLVSSTDVMPANAITLDAKFTQDYTIEYYLNKVGSQSDFELFNSELKNGFVGETISIDSPLDGTSFSSNETQKNSIVIDKSVEKNVIKLYCQRDSLEIKFNSNYPGDGVTNSTVSRTIEYAQNLYFPTDFSYEGYEIAGWARVPNGEIVYSNNLIFNSIYNKNDGENVSYKADRPGTLYAVWKKAYKDMKNGKDEIYQFDDSSKIVYLKRDGIYFEGEFNAKTKEFEFFNVDSDTSVLYGKIVNNDYFMYADEENSGITFSKYSQTTGEASSSVRIQLDKFDGLTYYSTKDDQSIESSKGTYVINDGIYKATFTTGPLAGKTIEFQVGYISGTPAFLERNEEEVALGTIGVYSVEDYALKQTSFNIVLDGYGTTTFNSTNYYYMIQEDETTNTKYLFLFDSSNNLIYSFKFEKFNDKNILVLYNSSSVLEANVGDMNVKLDGCYTAVLTQGNTKKTGVYYLESAAFGDAIINIKVSDTEFYRYIINSSKDEEGNVSYTLSEVSEDYKEFYYLDQSNLYQAPLFVFEGKTLTLYGYTEKGQYVKVSKGTFTLDSNTKMYTYTADTYYPEGMDAISTLLNLNDVKNAQFKITYTKDTNVTYWYSYTKKNGSLVSIAKKYNFTGKDEGKYVQFVGNVLEYFDGTKVTECEYQVQEDNGMVAFKVSDDNILYFEYNDDGSVSFCSYPQTYYLYEKNQANQNEYLFSDKNGKLSYNVINDKEQTSTVYGTLEAVLDSNGKEMLSLAGYIIYEFTSEDENIKFKFVFASTSSGVTYFLKQDNNYSGVYSGNNGSFKIELDGFGMVANVYTSQSNEPEQYGYYIKKLENGNVQIVLTSSSYEFSFDIIDINKKTVKMVGVEEGTYPVLDNQSIKYQITFDGYGNAIVYDALNLDNDGNPTVIDKNATYTKNNDSEYVVTFDQGEHTVTLTGNLFTYSNSNAGSSQSVYFVVSYSYLSKKFINATDWTILDLDSYGNATFYNKEGVLENGAYRIITEDLLFYTDTNQSNLGLYQYDLESGEVVKKLTDGWGYFTSDFDSIVFYEYGVLAYDGKEAYYTINDNSEATLYVYEPSNSSANEYGFVEKEFGELSSKKEYEGKEYYISEGTAIPFSRLEGNKNKYPIVSSDGGKHNFGNLNFTPTGKEFDVTGRIKIDDKSYQCEVVRKKINDNGKEAYSTYVLVNNYRLDVNVSYMRTEDGDSTATYEVIGMQYIESLAAGDYLSLVELVYQYYQQDITSYYPNEYGEVNIYYEYDEDGKVSNEYVTSTLNLPYIVDTNGKAISFEKSDFKLVQYPTAEYIVVTTTASDGYTYVFYLSTTSISQPKTMYGINVALLTRRYETVTEDGYKVLVEEVVALNGTNEMADDNSIGEIAAVSIQKKNANGEYETLPVENYFLDKDNNFYVVARTYNSEDKNVIESTTYWKLDYTKESLKNDKLAPLYKNFTLTNVKVNCYYKNDGSVVLDVLLDNTVKYFEYDGKTIDFTNSSYDESTNTYTLTVDMENEVKTYTVVIGENNEPTVTVTSKAK